MISGNVTEVKNSEDAADRRWYRSSENGEQE